MKPPMFLLWIARNNNCFSASRALRTDVYSMLLRVFYAINVFLYKKA